MEKIYEKTETKRKSFHILLCMYLCACLTVATLHSLFSKENIGVLFGVIPLFMCFYISRQPITNIIPSSPTETT